MDTLVFQRQKIGAYLMAIDGYHHPAVPIILTTLETVVRKRVVLLVMVDSEDELALILPPSSDDEDVRALLSVVAKSCQNASKSL